MKTHSTRWLASPALVALALAGASSALYAQNNGGMGRGGPRAGGPGGRHGGGRGMTPDQMEQMAARMREQQVRGLLERSGVTDQAVVGAVEKFSSDQAVATRALREKARLLNDALDDASTPNTKISTLLADFKAAAATEQARREQAMASLNAATGYSRNPRLEAALTLAGVIGQESSLLRPAMGGPGGGPGGPRGRGGPGGGQGPEMGGPGGFDGPPEGGPGGFDGPPPDGQDGFDGPPPGEPGGQDGPREGGPPPRRRGGRGGGR